MIKLVVTDVDGTLVEDGSPNIDPELFETILKLREKGIQFAVASGRPWASVERTFDPVKKKVFYIANNGSYIGCYGRSLYVYPIDRQIMKRLILAVRQIPGLSMVYAAARSLVEEFKDILQISCAGDMWLDCMAKDVNKGHAVKVIQDSLGIKPEETMAFGDQLNDVEMLKQAYYSFAVANARDEVKKAARFQADSNVNNGVLKILQNLL